MYPELTNLLPAARIRAFRTAYFIRLAVIAVVLLGGVIIVHALLLLPSYLFTLDQATRQQHELENITANLQTAEEKQVDIRLSALRDNVAYLSHLKASPTASAAIRAIIETPHPGITMNGFTFSPGAGANSRMTIAGTATTRDTLRQFEQTLAALPFVTSSDLPISAYAKETNIPFIITLTGPLQP